MTLYVSLVSEVHICMARGVKSCINMEMSKYAIIILYSIHPPSFVRVYVWLEVSPSVFTTKNEEGYMCITPLTLLDLSVCVCGQRSFFFFLPVSDYGSWEGLSQCAP